MILVPRHAGSRGLWVGFAAAFLVMLGWTVNIGKGTSLASLDFLFKLRQPVDTDEMSPVFIVAIDGESFEKMPERWIWPRSFHAQLIRKIMQGRPKVIAFDIIFAEKSAADPKQDADLVRAVRAAECVVMASIIHMKQSGDRLSEKVVLPFEMLRRASYGTGIVNTPGDSDAFVRRSRLVWKVHDERHYSLALEVLRKYLDVGKGRIDIEPDGIKFGGKTIPLDHNREMLINYCGPANTFRTIPYYQVFSGKFDCSRFKDAIVLVGATAEELHDTFHVPFTRAFLAGGDYAAGMPGVEIHANIIDTILRGRYIGSPPAIILLGLIFGMSMLVGRVTVQGGVFRGFLAVLTISVAMVVLAGYLFINRLQFMEFVHPIWAVWLSFVGCSIYRARILETHLKMRDPWGEPQ